MISDAYRDMIADARKKPQTALIGVVLMMGLVVTVILSPLFFIVVGAVDPNLNAITRSLQGNQELGATPGGAFVILASFSLLLLATALTAKHLHGRDVPSLTGRSAVMRAQFWRVAKPMCVLVIVLLFLPWHGDKADIEPNMALSRWVFWLPFAFLVLCIQVTAEEVFFRGYLQTQLTGVTNSHFFGIVGSAMLFGLGHFSVTAEGAGYFPMIWAFAFGVIVGDLTARAGSLGPAIAIHLANNAVAMLLAPPAGTLSGFGLSKTTTPIETLYSDPLLMIYEVLFLLIVWLVGRLALRR